MKLRSIVLAAAAAFAAPLLAQVETPQPSPKATLTQRVGLTDVTISYSRPSVKGRAIWGELVPWDKPWRTGTNAATTKDSFTRRRTPWHRPCSSAQVRFKR